MITSIYDGDGRQVVTTRGEATTIYIGSYYKWRGSAASAAGC